MHDVSADLVYHIKEKVNNATGSSEEKLLPFREQGLAGRVTYNYDKRYFLEGNFGYDTAPRTSSPASGSVSSRLPPSDGTSPTRISRPLKSAVTNLKLRASYGLLGDDSLGDDHRFP